MIDIKKKNGCDECHIFWQKYPHKRPNYLTVNFDRHTRLYQCLKCKTFWEEFERFAVIISNKDVKKYYGIEFLTGK